ncbi:hypothetical protein IWQ56_003092, partial [Coemansia nantahalensis]
GARVGGGSDAPRDAKQPAGCGSAYEAVPGAAEERLYGARERKPPVTDEDVAHDGRRRGQRRRSRAPARDVRRKHRVLCCQPDGLAAGPRERRGVCVDGP